MQDIKHTICSIAKDEHLYLDEWISHHLSIGFDEITIVEDYGSKPHKDITDKYGEKVKLIPAEKYFGTKKNENEAGIDRQRRCYNKYIYNHKDENQWTAFIDIDEFIEIDSGETLESITSYCESLGIESLAMFWKVFNANGHIERPIGTLRQNYTKSIDYTQIKEKKRFLCYVKSFVRMNGLKTDLFVENVHNTYNNRTIENKDGNIRGVDLARAKTYNKIHINHYFTKSWEDWCVRIKRGNLTKGLRKYEDFFTFNPDLKIYQEELINKIKNS